MPEKLALIAVKLSDGKVVSIRVSKGKLLFGGVWVHVNILLNRMTHLGNVLSYGFEVFCSEV